MYKRQLYCFLACGERSARHYRHRFFFGKRPLPSLGDFNRSIGFDPCGMCLVLVQNQARYRRQRGSCGFEASVDGEKNEHRSTDPCLLDGFGVAFLFGHVCVAHIWLVCGGRPYRSRRPIIARLLFMGAALRYRHEGKDPSRTTVSCLRYFDLSLIHISSSAPSTR